MNAQFYFFNNCPYGFSFLKIICWYLFRFRKQHFITVFIKDQHFFLPYLVNFTSNYFAYTIFIFFYQGFAIQVLNRLPSRLVYVVVFSLYQVLYVTFNSPFIQYSFHYVEVFYYILLFLEVYLFSNSSIA